MGMGMGMEREFNRRHTELQSKQACGTIFAASSFSTSSFLYLGTVLDPIFRDSTLAGTKLLCRGLCSLLPICIIHHQLLLVKKIEPPSLTTYPFSSNLDSTLLNSTQLSSISEVKSMLS
jgi:hypothetical protein